jgi:hypothetical protein
VGAVGADGAVGAVGGFVEFVTVQPTSAAAARIAVSGRRIMRAS